MSMYRREHAGFDYELWLRRGHTGTPDDFLEWLRGGSEGGDVDIDMITESAKARLSSYWLPIANERHYGSILWPEETYLDKGDTVTYRRMMQGLCSFYGGGKDYVVFATEYADGHTKMHRYCVDDDTLIEKAVDEAYWGHYNDMTYCTEDGHIYVANYNLPQIEIFNTNLEHTGRVDMSGWGNPEHVNHGRIHSIAWSEKDACFYVGFVDMTADSGTTGLFRFDYEFRQGTRIELDYSNYNRQCLHVDSKTGNIIQVKFRNRSDSSFRFPPGNRAQIYSKDGELIAVTYLDSIYEIEGICELSDGQYFIGYAMSDLPLTGDRYRVALFTRAALRSDQNASLFSTYSKVHLNTSDYLGQVNNVYYNEAAAGVAESGGESQPYKTWPAILNMLRSNHTTQLNVNLLSDMTWAVTLSNYNSTIRFLSAGELSPDQKRAVSVRSLSACGQSVMFSNVRVITPASATWDDNNILQFAECDLTGMGNIDLLRTRIVRLDQPTVYGENTRLAGVGTSFRIYGDTTPEEQYVLRGGTSAAANISCSALTAISQIRMNMNMVVSTVTAGRMTDIPFWLRNGDWDNGTATCSTAGDTAEKTITVAGIASLTDGLEFLITFTHANTAEGDLSLNLNGLGAVPLLFDDWADGEQVCVKCYNTGTDAWFVRYGLPFTGRAEVLSDSAMLYVIAHGGEEYRRIVEFNGTTITSDSGWQTRDDEIYPINTVVRPEAMADNWAGKRVVVFGDSITNWSHGGYWTNYLVSEAGCAVTNRSVSGAGFARGVNTIIGQLGTKATVTEAGLTATALYGGLWGNDLTYTIAEVGDTFTVTVSLDGEVVLTYTGLATIGDLKTASSGNGYLTFDGTDATALVAGESIALDGAELVESGLFNGAAAVIVAAGTNDANSTETASTIRAAIQTVIDTVKANTTVPIIFITPIRRSHDSSGGAGTETYSRQRLVGAAMCNVAVLNDCSVVNGYDFPIATTGTEWVTDMTLDGLHPEAAGKNVYAHSFLTAVGYAPKATIKILGIGNSHTRDALYYLYEILAHAGYNATVGHYYWGNSSLKEQYDALMDGAGESWPTDGKDYYRKYDKDGTLSNHRHADDHVHKLDYALTDDDWDVVVFQNATTECAHYTGFYAPDFNIDTFVDEVKQRVGNPNLRVGLMAPHTRASDYAGDTIDGVLYTPDKLDGAIQSTIKDVAADMKHCDFIVNSGLAIRYARADENLDALGHDMTRIDLTNTEPPVNSFDKVHLEYGVPMFIAAMSYAMAVCGDEVGCISWTPGAPAFDARKIYGKNDVLEYNGTLYRKNVTTGAEAWDGSHWDEHDNAYLAYLGKLCARRAAFPTLERGSRTYYGVCDTAAATAAKEVTTVNGDFVLETGAMVRVKFVNDNSATGTTVNVDGTGAKTLKNLGGTSVRYAWRPNEDVDLVYNGTDYEMEGKGTASTTRYGITMLTDAADSTGNTTALAPNALAYPMRYIITGASIYDTGTTYSAGDRARKGYYLYEANKTTTGTWKPADWDVVDPLQTQIDALETRITALGG